MFWTGVLVGAVLMFIVLAVYAALARSGQISEIEREQGKIDG